jgi:hypothetical protein
MANRSLIHLTVAVGLLAVLLGMLGRDASAEDDGLRADLSLLEVHTSSGIACTACHSETPPEPRPGFAICVACHGTMIGTDSPVPAQGPDPHRSPHLGPDETPDCTSCHRVHQPSEVSCTMCHRAFPFNIP